MARIITTQQPLVVKKERRLELITEHTLYFSPGEVEERTARYRRNEQIPDEVVGNHVKGDNPWDVDYIIWEWWEITV